MPKKLTHEFVKSHFEKDNYIPKFTKYINSKTKLDFICPNGHKHSITWTNWKSGKRCFYCSSNVQPEINFIKKEFENDSYNCLSNVYKNNKTKLDYICSNGHKHFITWTSWTSGNRCPHCNGTARKTIEEVKVSFEKDCYICLEEVYINSSTKMKYRCPNGHQHSITWNDWIGKNNRCPSCFGNAKKSDVVIQRSLKLEGYKLNNITKVGYQKILNILCPKGHEYKVYWSNWYTKGYRCPKCTDCGTSNFEKEVKQFVLDQNQEIIENDRTTIKGNKGKFLELDILLSCKTKAIECNGVYWHSKSEVMERDKIKQKQCKKLGIKLLTITDAMWYNDKEECKKVIIDL